MNSLWITSAQRDYCPIAMQRMQEDMSLKLTDLCDELGISDRHLRRVFIDKVGIRPKHYQKLVRLNAVLEKLDAHEFEKIIDVAYECGYYDQSHFNQDFKEFMGMTPSDYISERADSDHIAN